MEERRNEIAQTVNTCVTIRLYNIIGILNIPKNILFISRMFFGCFWMFFGCFLDIFVCLEHPITSKIQIYAGYIFEKKEANVCISSNREKVNLTSKQKLRSTILNFLLYEKNT